MFLNYTASLPLNLESIQEQAFKPYWESVCFRDWIQEWLVRLLPAPSMVAKMAGIT